MKRKTGFGTGKNMLEKINSPQDLKALDLRGLEALSTFLYFQWGGRHCEADWEKQVGVFMNYLWF